MPDRIEFPPCKLREAFELEGDYYAQVDRIRYCGRCGKVIERCTLLECSYIPCDCKATTQE